MPWLCRGEEVLASAEVADTRRTRRRGLLGCDSTDGALVLIPARAVHTLGMRFDLDVAYLDGEGNVLDAHRMRRHRVGLPRWRARSVVEAQAGAFARWSLRPGDRLEVR
ncbi:MAG: hypothetical protein JWN67_3246 [Actinomycetia bacterium]|nr:hypothetical protein [Actinomycetes bacterium]